MARESVGGNEVGRTGSSALPGGSPEDRRFGFRS
jgi:hypothetical protein